MPASSPHCLSESSSLLLRPPSATPTDRSSNQPTAFYAILFTTSTLLAMGIGSKLEIQTDLICRSLPPILSLSQPDCHANPAVTSRLAQLLMAQSIALGLLSALSTGYWCSLSESRGRRFGFLVTLLSIAANELVFVLVRRRAWHVGLLVLGSLVEGLLGGPSTFQALMASYIHDNLPHRHSSATVGLSICSGVVMAGTAIGPSLAAWLLAATANDLLAPSYALLLIVPPLALFTRFALPDSRPAPRLSHPRSSKCGILEPLQALRPSVFGSPDLLLLAIGFGLYSSIVGSFRVKLQYAAFEYDWGTVETGRYLSLLGASRVLALLVVIPSLLSLWRLRPRRDVVVQLPFVSPEAGCVADDWRDSVLDERVAATERGKFGCARGWTSVGSAQAGDGDRSVWSRGAKKAQRGPQPTSAPPRDNTRGDIHLACVSIMWEVLCYTALLLSTSVATFVVPSALQALGGSTGPAIQSVALSLAARKGKSGEVIACLSLLQILMSSLLGPLIFGSVYAAWPSGKMKKSFFVVALIFYLITLGCVLSVGVNQKENKKSGEGEGESSGEDVGTSGCSSEEEEEEEEG